MPKPRLVLLSVVISALSGAAFAQQAGPARQSPDHGRWDPAEMREHAEAHRAERMKALHDVLGIQPAQESAFSAFASAMRPPEENGDDRDFYDHGRDGSASMAMTTPERLDRMKAEMDRRFAAMRESFDRRAVATRTLYAALDTRQRAAMDALPELSGHHGGWGHDHHMGPSGPMGSGM